MAQVEEEKPNKLVSLVDATLQGDEVVYGVKNDTDFVVLKP